MNGKETMYCLQEIDIIIEQLRDELIFKFFKNGGNIQDTEILQLSQRLDEHLNDLDRYLLRLKGKRTNPKK